MARSVQCDFLLQQHQRVAGARLLSHSLASRMAAVHAEGQEPRGVRWYVNSRKFRTEFGCLRSASYSLRSVTIVRWS